MSRYKRKEKREKREEIREKREEIWEKAGAGRGNGFFVVSKTT